jgi:uncharacterized protein Yka (UPF0111/DUF47 family)
MKQVAVLGARRLMLPLWIKAALSANDRIKLCLTVLQAAARHATQPEAELPDLSAEIKACSMDAPALRDFIAKAHPLESGLSLPGLAAFMDKLAADLALLARPVAEAEPPPAPLLARVQQWQETLKKPRADALGDTLSDTQLTQLVSGSKSESHSLHRLVMDLHKQINQLSAALSSEFIDGASVWEIADADRPRVAAFMRGLHRTAALKFDHPGLETSATRDGDQLLIQNDIGSNDAHVLVLRIRATALELSYSDLHPRRLVFFQALLAPFGAQWTGVESRLSAELNGGSAFAVGTALFACADEAALLTALEGLGSRIVFLIDWNRARKRLGAFVSKEAAVAVLTEAARLDCGHRAWLQLGGETLLYTAMQAAGEGAFRVGDRLDEVLGAADAQAYLLSVLRLCSDGLKQGQPAALVADEARMLLAQQVRRRSREFELLIEHASYCQALAQALADGLAQDAQRSEKDAAHLAARAKGWERKADHLVMQARDNAVRQPRWLAVARLVEQSDDIADALEEAAFLISLMADQHLKGWNHEVGKVLKRLARTVLTATQDHLKALTMARSLGSESAAAENDDFLAATWRVLQAERDCDAQLREARRVILGAIEDAPSLLLVNDLAQTLELSSDCLLTAAYGLRELAFNADTPQR